MPATIILLMTWVILGLRVEPTYYFFLNGDDVKLPSKYLCLCQQTGLLSTMVREASSYSGQQSILRCVSGQSAENQRLSAQSYVGHLHQYPPLPPRLRKHHRRDRKNVRIGGQAEMCETLSSVYDMTVVCVSLQYLGIPAQDLLKISPAKIPAKMGKALSRLHPLQGRYWQLIGTGIIYF